MNSIRSAILSGEGLAPRSPVARKQKRAAPAEPGSLNGIAIKREQSRKVDQRREDRHSSLVEGATVRLRGGKFEVAVVNVSAGGAMIEAGALDAQIGEPIEIRFADCDFSRCVVRWIRADRIGIEFCEETTINGSRAVQAFIIDKLRGGAGCDGETAGGQVKSSRTTRHRLVWTGTIHCEGESTTARVRNISTDGAMIESDWDFHIGTPVMLDLDAAGTIPATVRWCRGGQLGLKFDSRFDLRALAECEPAEPEAIEAPSEREPGGYHIPLGDLDDDDGKKGKDGRLSLSEVADLYGKGMTRR